MRSEILIARRFLLSEKLEKERIPQQPKRKWFKVNCPGCGYKIEYAPKKPDWTRELRCPECTTVFRVPEEIPEIRKT